MRLWTYGFWNVNQVHVVVCELPLHWKKTNLPEGANEIPKVPSNFCRHEVLVLTFWYNQIWYCFKPHAEPFWWQSRIRVQLQKIHSKLWKFGHELDVWLSLLCHMKGTSQRERQLCTMCTMCTERTQCIVTVICTAFAGWLVVLYNVCFVFERGPKIYIYISHLWRCIPRSCTHRC